MSKQDVIEVAGVVTDSYPNAMFEVTLENGHKILATISGKLQDELHSSPDGRQGNR